MLSLGDAMTPANERHLVDNLGILIDALEVGGDERELRLALRHFTRAAGMKRFAFMSVSGDASRIFTDLPADWEDRYHAEDYVRIDPVVRHAKRSHKPFAWTLPALSNADREERRFCREIGEVGVVSGVTVPMQAGFGRTAMLSFMTNEESTPEIDVKVLHRAVPAVAYTHLHTTPTSFVETQRPAQILTPRELACVMWTSLGKKKAEIALMYGLSEKTVRFHLENARSKLNASNAPHMVRLAFEAGVIAPR